MSTGQQPSQEDILVIDDESWLTKRLCDKLHELGFGCIEANDVKVALELIATRKVSHVILDYVLPGGDPGLIIDACLLRKIKVTVWTGEPGLVKGIDQGCVCVLRKDFDLSAIVERLRAA